MHREPNGGRKARERTCVGCGRTVDARELVRLVVAEDEVAFDLAGGAFGRGAHLHATPECLAKAPRGLSRAYKREMKVTAGRLGAALVAACDRRIQGLLLAARRSGGLTLGTDDAMTALRRGAPLAVVATDAGASLGGRLEMEDAVRQGRAFAWKTKGELGALFGRDEVAVLAVTDARFAGELQILRAATDAGAAATTREGAGCSSTYPEAR